MGYASAQAWIQFLVVLLLTGLTFLFSRGYVHYRAG
jgi:multiple sugar transport system permease protein